MKKGIKLTGVSEYGEKVTFRIGGDDFRTKARQKDIRSSVEFNLGVLTDTQLTDKQLARRLTNMYTDSEEQLLEKIKKAKKKYLASKGKQLADKKKRQERAKRIKRLHHELVKTFDGKKYDWCTSAKTKEEAIEKAKYYKSHGSIVRYCKRKINDDFVVYDIYCRQ